MRAMRSVPQDPVWAEEAVAQAHARRGVPAGEQQLSRRATVDLPTATEPAMPTTKGSRALPTEEGVALGGGTAAPVDVKLRSALRGR